MLLPSYYLFHCPYFNYFPLPFQERYRRGNFYSYHLQQLPSARQMSTVLRLCHRHLLMYIHKQRSHHPSFSRILPGPPSYGQKQDNSKLGESSISVPLLVTLHHPDCPGPPLSPVKIFFFILSLLTNLINIVIKNVTSQTPSMLTFIT